MSFYGDKADLILRMLRKYGFSLLHKRTLSTVDPITQVASTTVQTQSLIGLVRPVTQESFYLFEDTGVDDSITRRGRVVIVAAKDIARVPDIGDHLEFDGESWRVRGRRVVNPAGTPLLYRLGVSS